ncbi:MAG: hypothetical protein IT276_08775 [Ignavibacteriaceae bacterium]|nr:hypothetical protein [Ignavibacterium sp.]MCC6254994.1 hypothetical protein [Ignavibacteriaceae bacterium]HRN26436.1 hypothetical protein [Ignavibacteriaceae bacterium]HRP92025.1 hypothetical protein [Ignavibacteriaceae bacterium]HRQ53959.1 hypothetical protein [Ignavibacteriaceae bacterium]
MEILFDTEKLELNITVTEERIFCEYGFLEFSLDEDVVIVNSLSVYLKRSGIGTSLVKEFETLAYQKGFLSIEVPASPTREAILFWKNLGYKPAFNEDKYWANKIIRSNRETAWDTLSGVVTLKKQLPVKTKIESK